MRLQFLLWREWRSRPGRMMLTLMSIAFAVAAVLGSSLAGSTVRRSFAVLTQTLEGPPTVEIIAAGGGRFPLDGLPPLAAMPEVRGVTPLMFRVASTVAPIKRWRTFTLGLGEEAREAWSRLELTSGRLPGPGEALIDAGAAKSLALTPPMTLRLLGRRGIASLSIVGCVSSASLREYGEGVALVMPLETAHGIFGWSGQVDRVRLLVDSERRADALCQRLSGCLPSELIARKATSRLRVADAILRSTELALEFASALALAMATFIILNTLRMNFSERRWQFSVMRAIGATSSQIERFMLVEGVWLGLLGSALGLPGGLLLAWVLTRAMETLMNVTMPRVWPDASVILLSAAIGPATALAAAWFVARQSRRLSALEGIVGVEPGGSDRCPRRALVMSVTAWGLAVSGLVAVATGLLAPGWAIPTGLVSLVAFILFIPAVLGPFTRGLVRLLPRALDAESFLASHQVQQRSTRVGLTVGVLVVAISNGLGLGHGILNNVSDVRSWYRRSLSGDYFLQPIEGKTPAAPASQNDLVQRLRQLDETVGIDTVRFRTATASSESVMAILRDFPQDAPLPWNYPASQEVDLRHRLAEGQAAVSSSLARQLQIEPGDSVRLEIQGRVHMVEAAAIVNDYSLGGQAVLLDSAAAKKAFDVGEPDLYILTRTPESPTDLEERLRALAAQQGFLVRSFAELRAQFDRLVDGIVGSLFVLMAIGFVVGGLGVSNTLAMSVLEQTRELGLLRIVGMTRRQVQRLVMVEALLIGLLGVGLGLLGGMSTAYVIHVCNWTLLDRAVAFEFHGWLLVANVLGCLLVAALAAWIPARRAANLDLLTALAYE